MCSGVEVRRSVQLAPNEWTKNERERRKEREREETKDRRQDARKTARVRGREQR
ncbi:MAG TPA: hypothetical protein V6C97_24320 [Oculatellaceae cyanobacterium]